MQRVSLSSAEIIAGNQDLLTEILIRVPAKPLLKFKCVSKQWLSLISDPKFCIWNASHQRILNPTPDALLLNNFYSSTPTFQFVPLEGDGASSYSKVAVFDDLNVSPYFRLKIKNSCNGLILCMSIFCGRGFDDAGSELKVMNRPHCESLKIMPMPPIFSTVNRFREIMYFGESRGHLHSAGIRSRFVFEFDVWEMASDYSRWSLLHHVSPHRIKRAFPEQKFDAFSILNVLQAEKEEKSKVVISVDSRAMSLNLFDDTSKKLSDLAPGLEFPAELGYEGHDAFQYFQSLVCVWG
ncbi:unnamed protein product [Dovyalis caffra]|uniref:F-box domain-containing protein n=1 Tax=Dovyalis caffra TaxID=77055 RepID=A0AAV1RZK3_9ROSI|nr:unnamed protein product [Dovyalis caffra]